jgi:hypothetical protein
MFWLLSIQDTELSFLSQGGDIHQSYHLIGEKAQPLSSGTRKGSNLSFDLEQNYTH